MNVTIAHKFESIAATTFIAFSVCIFSMPNSARIVITRKPPPAPK